MKEIVEELGLEGAKLSDTPLVVSQPGNMDSDSHTLSLRDATRIEPERCGHGHTQESGAISARAADHLDALQMESAVRPQHGKH